MVNDSISLGRTQRVDVFGADGRRRRIVDHPLNSPLVGVADPVAVVRASDLTVQAGDTAIAIYGGRAGGSCRIATAEIERVGDGALRLADWRIEPGFARDPAVLEGRTVHRIVKAAKPTEQGPRRSLLN